VYITFRFEMTLEILDCWNYTHGRLAITNPAGNLVSRCAGKGAGRALLFLATACGDDAQLCSQVLSLISAFEQETSFLETPVLGNAGPSVSQMLCTLGQVLHCD